MKIMDVTSGFDLSQGCVYRSKGFGGKQGGFSSDFSVMSLLRVSWDPDIFF